MVWSQYVYEASAGLDVDAPPAVLSSDDDAADQDVGLNICDWQLKYSEELWDIWDLMKMLIRDAFLEHILLTHDYCTYNDFVEFCYYEHYGVEEYTGPVPFRENLRYIWMVVWNEMKYLNFAPGANFSHFVQWVVEHSEINNLTL